MIRTVYLLVNTPLRVVPDWMCGSGAEIGHGFVSLFTAMVQSGFGDVSKCQDYESKLNAFKSCCVCDFVIRLLGH